MRFGDLTVGRFEATRAQFAQFDDKYAVASGTENYPANGVAVRAGKGILRLAEPEDGADVPFAQRGGSGETL